MNISVELTLVTKLKAVGVKCNAFDGLTTHAQRREKIRAAIQQVPADRADKLPELERDFLMAYGEHANAHG